MQNSKLTNESQSITVLRYLVFCLFFLSSMISKLFHNKLGFVFNKALLKLGWVSVSQLKNPVS